MTGQPSQAEKGGDTLRSPSDVVSPAKGNTAKEPLSKRRMTTREKIILLESSKLDGNVYPPWTSPNASDFGTSQFIDVGELSLSNDQLEVFDDWQRPADMFRTAQSSSDSGPTMVADEAIDLVQDVTTDCSVVASLCAASARLAHGQSDLIICNLYPRDTSLQQPIISPNGKYIVRLHFNGCPRRVIIDDRLPASRTSRTLHVIDRNNTGLLWPALIEKAYLKIRGGYDFPGSNSGTDLWVLTGWIPEQIFIQSDDLVRNTLWRRLHNAFNYGDVLITMGTGKLTQSEEEGVGLVGEHDYAVIDLKECEGQQLFLIKNPWSVVTVRKGHAFRDNTMTEISKLVGSISIADTVDSGGVRCDPLPPGTFWISLSDVFQSFEFIYLNWNLSLFSCREDVHFKWDLSACRSPEGSFASNPQYAVRSKAGGTVWLLLNRHFTSKGPLSSSVHKTSSSTQYEPGFISLYAFLNDGERVFLSDGATVRGPYVDSPNTLLKLELPNTRAFTIVVSEQTLPRSRNTFTLSGFSMAPISISEAREEYDHSTWQRGTWTASTAGGNASSLSYYTNPQFSLRLTQASDLSLLLENPVENLPVQVKLVWGQGRQIHSVTSRDVVGDSGEYRKGFAFAKLHNVQAGVYTIVCSTFERGQLGDFTLRANSTSACTVERVAVEAAGRFVTPVRSAVFTAGNSRVLAPLVSQRLNRLSLSARSSKDSSGYDRSTCSPLKLSLEHGQGPSKETLATSDEDSYLDGHVGVRTPDVNIPRNMCAGQGVWVVIERLAYSGLQRDEYVHVEVLSDEPIDVGGWGLGQG